MTLDCEVVEGHCFCISYSCTRTKDVDFSLLWAVQFDKLHKTAAKGLQPILARGMMGHIENSCTQGGYTMAERRFLLVDADVLPEVFVKVLQAKELLASGAVSNISAAAKLESIEVVDEYTVTFRYPNAYFAYLMDFCYPETMVLVSPAVLEEGNYQSMNGVVGTGPYVYEEIVDGDYVRFVRNENYWGEQPYYDEVIVKYIPDASARLQALQSGEIDLIYGSALLTWDDYQQATSLPNIAGAVAESDSKTRNLVLNASGVLSDLKVREAVAYAIDKETLSEGLTYGEETPADHLFPDGIPYTDVEPEMWSVPMTLKKPTRFWMKPGGY